jgi:MFS superfamily sulfate permease-like transporter
VLSLGALALSPLGADAARVGAVAAFTTAAIGGLVYGALAGSRLPCGAVTTTSAVMVAAMLATLLRDPALPAEPAARLACVVAAIACTVAVMGVVQLLMAALGWAELVRKVPQPVLAGFINAIALLVLLAQFQPLLGVSAANLWSEGTTALARVQPGALMLGLATALTMQLLRVWRPGWPAALMILVTGTLAHGAAAHWLPGLSLGPTVGGMSLDLPIAGLWSTVGPAGGGFSPPWGEVLLRHASTLVATGAALAVVGALESMLVVLDMDQRSQHRTNARRELAAIGLANLLGSACGALPMGTSRARTAAVWQAGGRSKIAGVAASVTTLLLFLVGAPLLNWLPVPVLAGIMITVAWTLVDPWTRRLLGQLRAGDRAPALWQSLAVVVLVLVATVWLGPLFGVLLGIGLAVLNFVRQLGRSLVRARFSAAQRPSRRVYPDPLEALLAPLRQQVEVVELEGPLFFGNAEQLAPLGDALPAGCRLLVLDLRRVTAVDESGAQALAHLAMSLRQRHTGLLLAGVQSTAATGQRLRLFGAAGRDGQEWFVDADHAIEAAEQRLLQASIAADAQGAPASLPGDPSLNVLLEGLEPAELARVRDRLSPRRVAAGEAVFRHGDAADAVYLVVSGSIRIQGPRTSEGPGPRYASLTPGTIFGEAALLDGGGRTADAVADVDSELLRLDQAGLEALAQDDPALGLRLYRNLAAYLARRLRIASAAWSAAAS